HLDLHSFPTRRSSDLITVKELSTIAPVIERTPPNAFVRPELLSPAGDWECAKAAVENGADAIYFGLERFNARMRAHNFTEVDLRSEEHTSELQSPCNL